MQIVPWCNGSTSDSGSASLGSSPSGITYKIAAISTLIIVAILLLNSNIVRDKGIKQQYQTFPTSKKQQITENV